MDEKHNHGNKPLRPAFNKTMDLAKTYFKNGDKKNMHSTKDKGSNLKKEDVKDNEITVENEQDNKQNENTFTETEVSDLLAKVENLTKEKNEAKEIMLRNAAELENFRRRTMKEKEDIVMYANERLLSKFSEILDTMDVAVDSANQSTDYNALLQGLVLLRDKTNKLFEEAGVKQIQIPVGQEFDVDTMDAILAMPSDDTPEGSVLQIVSPGYTYHDKILKHAKVITSSGKAE